MGCERRSSGDDEDVDTLSGKLLIAGAVRADETVLQVVGDPVRIALSRIAETTAAGHLDDQPLTPWDHLRAA